MSFVLVTKWCIGKSSRAGIAFELFAEAMIRVGHSEELARQQAGASQISRVRFQKVEDAAHAVFLEN